jgi:hypothetical protein
VAVSEKQVWEIADVVWADWKNVSPYAKPYLEAMSSLSSVNDNYFADSGKSVVSYFLANAGSWKGEVAKSVKAELKALVK